MTPLKICSVILRALSLRYVDCGLWIHHRYEDALLRRSEASISSALANEVRTHRSKPRICVQWKFHEYFRHFRKADAIMVSGNPCASWIAFTRLGIFGSTSM